MKNKKKYLLILLTIVTICFVFLMISKRTKPAVYSFGISDDELRLKNLTIVSSNDFCYIPDNYYIEKIHEDNDIRNVFIEVSYKDNLLVDFAFQFDHLTTVTAPIDKFINDLKISKASTVVVRFKYTVEGVDKEFYELVDLTKYVKYE